MKLSAEQIAVLKRILGDLRNSKNSLALAKDDIQSCELESYHVMAVLVYLEISNECLNRAIEYIQLVLDSYSN